MDRKVDIKKTVFDRDGYKETIDRNFKFLQRT